MKGTQIVKSVTLDCGAGVQLSESTATDFIISLPPVLFSNGFTVTVTDSEDKEYTVESTVANTVLRSSILVMPVVELEESGSGTPEEDEDAGVKVLDIAFNKSTLTLAPTTSYSIVTTVVPDTAKDKTLTWSSSAADVAAVDQSGVITAVSGGTATITAVAVGGASKSCTVNVVSLPTLATATADYKDEYGVNHGKGIAIGGTVWAPVNCGYKAANGEDKGYPYGKLYQWGRKYSQGYDENDASYPSGENLKVGPVNSSWGSLSTYADAFFTVGSSSYDWCQTQIDDMWRDSNGKTTKDPCPDGWRVPTYDELYALQTDCSSWTTNEAGQYGRYFSGVSTTQYDTPPFGENKPQIFLPAAGSRYYDGDLYGRGNRGNYWSSSTDGSNAYFLNFYALGMGMYAFAGGYRAIGLSVRCVQVID